MTRYQLYKHWFCENHLKKMENNNLLMKNKNIEQRVKQMYQYIPYPYYGENPLDDKYLKHKEFIR